MKHPSQPNGFTPLDESNRHLTGFTLMELMIGLIISIVLASIAIPSFSKAIEKTKVKDAQSTLAALFSSEKIYRLDQGSYGTCCGTASNLIANNYITNPNAGNTTWAFDAAGGTGGIGTTFEATAARANEGPNPGATIIVDQNFSGLPNTSPGYGGRTYRGNHPLRD